MPLWLDNKLGNRTIYLGRRSEKWFYRWAGVNEIWRSFGRQFIMTGCHLYVFAAELDDTWDSSRFKYKGSCK
jgi:hypothetical protein